MSQKDPERRASKGPLGLALENFAELAMLWTGSAWAFICALGVVIVWGLTGPMFRFSDTWQLVINTGTTVVTFLMVFLIQRAQNKESLAVQLKLNEIVAAIQGASNRLIDIEGLSEDELRVLRTHFQRLAERSKSESDITKSHSVEEAERRHDRKKAAARS